MDAFSAVVTTGIYCRPGCAARPSPANVRTFEVAAAAEAAGYRACHRCRPYRSTAPLDWSRPELLCRAVQLVVGGALDEGRNEAELAARLGMSARHLRRLFVAHLGVTPSGLARSRRAHFARRLLDDTDLTVTQVAFASGFGSVRQFNRACIEVFGGSPRELRARRRIADRLVADGGLVLRLPFDGQLDWAGMLAFLGPRAIPGVEQVEGDVYRRTIVVDGDPGVLELSPGGPEHLLLRAHLPHWENLIHLVERARRVAALDVPQADAVAHLQADPWIGRLVATRPGLRVPGAWDAFEMAVRTVLGQQVSVAAATTVARRLAERYGTPVPGLCQLGLTHLFPTPARLAEGDVDLVGLGLVPARAAAVQELARAVQRGDVRLDRSAPLDRLIESLRAVRGIGDWTANVIALRLGERDAFPASDLGVRRALARLAPGHGALEAAGGWSPWRATATIHLWMSELRHRVAA